MLFNVATRGLLFAWAGKSADLHIYKSLILREKQAIEIYHITYNVLHGAHVHVRVHVHTFAFCILQYGAAP